MIVKAATYNILHGENYPHRLQTGERVIDLALTAQTIRAMDVTLCGLNEVRNQSGGETLVNQAQIIAEHLGWNYAFTPAIPIQDGTYGNALVTKHPIHSVRAVPITTPKENHLPGTHHEDRVLLIAELEIEDRILTVLVCHFGLNLDEQEEAVRVVLREAAAVKTPLLFMGDLNVTPNHPIIQRLRAALKDTEEITDDPLLSFPSNAPDRKIDYIFTNARCTPLRVEIPQKKASDHLPLRAEVRL